MKIQESILSDKEIYYIRSKYWKSILANTIMFLMFGIPFYLINENGIKYEDFSSILFNAFFFMILLLLILNLIALLTSQKELRKDIKEKIKIKTEIIIKEKRELHSSSSTSNTHSTTYRLLFEKNDYLTVYDVGKSDFNKIKVGDIIVLECSKSSKWVIKIEWNSENIENKSYLK
ncbi:cytochrome P450 [Flavobacterium psychrophilum]|uniref:cytochrome P450 n=1 Tax=Flavobacterium psychrophilum TaxID=96345 RepID=UPI000A907A83|nr:cytochrome P450 [Flavobacterium psychrophilum]EKT3975131.1 cytochrome P450 [Flavobacterium psychrophilum]EKT4535361.1 cytochrome P450 [Flavobacterium psychrophilum]EKT4537797.1 cytochrome P450 [Flavobacterium psychrophilum]EKT4545926.1 cytochrome P450 [Flavobacterium psychrophilum]EKT4571965.1 cytochrome P450 [Flavobacterium psychrophilum]